MSIAILLLGLVPAAAPLPPFVAASTAEERPVGALLGLAADGSARLATEDRIVRVADLISLRRQTPLPPMPRGPLLFTSTGDRIAGDLRGGDDRSLRFQPAFTKAEWNVPLSAAAVVWIVKPPADTPAEPERYPWLPAKRNRDILRFRNGDVLPGTIDGFEKETASLRFKTESGTARVVAFEELSAIAFNPTLSRARPVKGPYVRLVLRDGTRLGAALPTADAAALKLRTLFGRTVSIPVVELVSLDVMQGKASYLADRKPKQVEQAGFLGTEWPWRPNRNCHGGPLRLLISEGQASNFDRGLGTHPHTKLTYDLAGKYRRFEAAVGLDAALGKRGRASIRILVDGQERKLPELERLNPGPARLIRIDVDGAKELTLVVDFGPQGDVQADVDWGDARLVE